MIINVDGKKLYSELIKRKYKEKTIYFLFKINENNLKVKDIIEVDIEKLKNKMLFNNEKIGSMKKFNEWYYDILNMVYFYKIRERESLYERAEDYEYLDIILQPAWNTNFKFQISDYLSPKSSEISVIDRNFPLFVTGGKGQGKTFIVLQTAIEYVLKLKEERDIEFNVLIFKKHNKLELLKPLENKIISEFDVEEVFKKSDILVFDDIHYMCEYIIEGKFPAEVLIFLLKKVIEKAKESKVILVSEDQLSYYADILDEEELYDLLPYFGEIRGDLKGDWNRIKEEKEKVNRIANAVISPINDSDYKFMLQSVGINEEDDVDDTFFFLYLYRNFSGVSPREMVRFIKLFGRQKICFSNFIKMTKDKLKEMGKEEFLPLLDYSIIPRIELNEYKKIKRRFDTFGDFNVYMKEAENLVKEIENIILQQRFVINMFFKEKRLEKNIEFIVSGKRVSKTVEMYLKICKLVESNSEIYNKVFPSSLKKVNRFKFFPIEIYRVISDLEERGFGNFWNKIDIYYRPYNNYMLLQGPVDLVWKKEYAY